MPSIRDLLFFFVLLLLLMNSPALPADDNEPNSSASISIVEDSAVSCPLIDFESKVYAPAQSPLKITLSSRDIVDIVQRLSKEDKNTTKSSLSSHHEFSLLTWWFPACSGMWESLLLLP